MKRVLPLAVLGAAPVAASLPLLPPHAIAGHGALAGRVRAEAIRAAVAAVALLASRRKDRPTQ